MTILKQIRALATSAVTWLMLAQSGLASASIWLHNQFPGNAQAERVESIVVAAIAFAGGLVLVVRRVVEVIPEQRQILPLPEGVDPIPVKAGDA